MDNLLVVRRTKAEVAQYLPPKQYVDMDVEFSLPLAHAYKAFTDEFVDNDDGSKGNALVYSLRAQQFATCEYEMLADNETAKPKPGGLSPKRDWLVDWLTQRNLRVDAADSDAGVSGNDGACGDGVLCDVRAARGFRSLQCCSAVAVHFTCMLHASLTERALGWPPGPL